MTSEEQMRQMLGLPPIGPSTSPTPTQPGAIPSYDLDAILGLKTIEKEEEDAGMFSSFLVGAGSGVSEPLTMIPGVREKLEFLEQYKGDDLRDKVAYGLGWLAGGLIPGAAVFKIGSAAARGLRLVKNVGAAGEVITDLTRMGKLVRGSVAGSVWAAGQEADDVQDWMQNVALNAAMFGVGDLAIDTGMRALGKVFKRAGSPPPAQELVDAAKASTTTGLDVQQSELMGRALSVVDDIIERGTGSALDMPSLDIKRLNMALGIEQLGLESVQDGVMKIIPSVGGDINDIKAVLDGLGDFTYTTVKRGNNTDVIVGKKFQFDYRMSDQYAKQGFVEGMEVLWKGKKRIIMKEGKEGVLWGYSVDNPTKKLHAIPRSEMHILPLMHTRSVQGLPDPGKWWAQFVQKYGEFPEGEMPASTLFKAGLTNKMGFEGSFQEFTKANAIFGTTKQDLKLYFLRRQKEVLRQIDPELADILETIGKSSATNLKNVHPEGRLRELASEKGFLQEWIPDEKGGWHIVLRNQVNGTSVRFADKNGAEAFLKSYAVDLEDMIPFDSPIGMGAISPSEGGVSVQLPHTAGELSNFNSPYTFTSLANIRPREGFIRQFENLLRQQGIDEVEYFAGSKQGVKRVAIHLWSGENGIGGFDNIRTGQVLLRNELNGKAAFENFPKRDWLGELVEMRGSKTKLKSIPEEVIDDWWETFTMPRADIAKEASKRGLSSQYVNQIIKLRDFWNDGFKRIAKSIDPEDVTTGDFFVENILPAARKSSSARWPRQVETALSAKGRKLNQHLKDFMLDGEAHGVIGKYERDPFTVTMKVLRHGLFQVHVKKHYDATKIMVGAMKSAAEQGRVKSDVGLVARSMGEYLSMTKGGLPETYYALNATADKLFNELNIKVNRVAFDRMINTMVSANYGAFMGFRLGLPIRNMTQLLVTTLPRVGSRNIAAGINATFTNMKAAKDELYRVGVLVEQGLPLAIDDAIMNKQLIELAKAGGTAQGRSAEAVEKIMELGDKVTDLANLSLGGSVKVFGKEIPVGLFGKSDEFLRSISYYAQKNKTINAINNWKTKGWTVEKFNDQAGLNQFGEAVTAEFHRRMSANQDDAISFVSKLLSDDTQYMYQLGAGPALFSHGVGRLFGMYGTWPVWYGEHLQRGLTQGSKADKIRFLGYTAAVNAAFMNAVYVTGVNLSRWTGLSSFEWAGGPFFDMFKDASTVWGGIQDDGIPTAARQLALGERGMTDAGPEAAVQGLGWLPGSPTQIRVKDPYRAFEQTVGMFTPGMYAIRDAMKVASNLQDGAVGDAMLSAFGMKHATTVGSTWPEMNFER